MRMSRLVGMRLREDPRDSTTASHGFMVRGGYIRMVSAGIYTLLPLAKRIVDKIGRIIREEMDREDGQEILMPVVLPRELWEESGRWDSVGAELLRFQDRNGKEMILGMTHEEAVVHVARSEINSYKQLPVMLYQVQTKYRDEARPRAGLIRVREFTMKDAYSFHETVESLEEYYKRMHAAYTRIFCRVGLTDCVSIESETGMMGGKLAHEFMALADCGEDTVFMSPDGAYKANKDVACSAVKFEKADPLPLEKVDTPGKKSIEEVADFLGKKHSETGKAVFYLDSDANLVFAMVRGDFEVNESKLRVYLGTSELTFAGDDEIRCAGAEPGYASPMGLDTAKTRVVVDRSVAESSNLVVGANEADAHYLNFNLERELPDAEIADIATVREGDPCPLTGKPLVMRRGIEVGNIFQLGTKYTESMNATYLDKNGKARHFIMGCYGIGLGRTMAAVIEQNHDEYGPVWPVSIAPFHVHICALNPGRDGVGDTAEKIYCELREKGIEVLLDDRGEKAGSAFNDADLIGIPFRITVSPKTLADKEVELKRRGERDFERIPLADAVAHLMKILSEESEKYS